VIRGHLYRNRSFTIRNDSTSSLDFSVSSVIQEGRVQGGGESELALSSSHFVLKLVRTLSLPPLTSKRVFIFYRPAQGSSQDDVGIREMFQGTRVLQRGAVCCSALQRVAARCSVVQCGAAR